DGYDLMYSHSRELACSPDGRWLAMLARLDNWYGPHLFEVATRRSFRLSGKTLWGLSSLAFTADGLVVGYQWHGQLHVWDVSTRAQRASLFLPLGGQPVMLAVFSRDGERLALGHVNGDVTVWRWRPLLDA